MDFVITVGENKEPHYTSQEWKWDVHEGMPSESNPPIMTGFAENSDRARWRAEQLINRSFHSLLHDFCWDGSGRYIYQAEDNDGVDFHDWLKKSGKLES